MTIITQEEIHNLLCSWVNTFPIASLTKDDLVNVDGDNLFLSKWLTKRLIQLFNDKGVKVGSVCTCAGFFDNLVPLWREKREQ